MSALYHSHHVPYVKIHGHSGSNGRDAKTPCPVVPIYQGILAWARSVPEERRKLLSPFLDRVYVDMECGMIGAIVRATAFRRLLESTMNREGSLMLYYLTRMSRKG